MRRKIIQHLFVYALGAALLFTLGMKFQSPITYSADTTSKFPLPLYLFSPINTPQIPPENKTEKSQSLIETTVKEQDTEQQSAELQEIKTGPSSTTYEVTAFYLNLRANAYGKSKILNVVKKGTLLDIVGTTENGWLKIKGGGYVHGMYAKAVGVNAQQAEITDQTPEKNQVIPNESGNSGEVQDNGDPDKPTSAVGTDSGLSEEDIALIFDGTALAGHGLEETILDVEEKYGINAFFTIAVMKLESGNGSSRLARSKNNLFGLNATSGDKNNKAFSFETKGDSVRKFGQLLSKNYVGKGYTTVEKIATKYCPANSKWSGLVKNIMKKDYGKLNVI
ncbi:glucosaminidase domain-containing protein [Cohnella silvisoli]|uniref:Glucosaminidase domain-containing protein n=1 Tax=Cohnella silvisoli TaxID=2873699 RepID=A0ABV1KNX7_9BACL|nr:glucosaminidase domain-containing protein [Cohnella silvisoli]MCD9020917.1 glucosaminidase domain-containing protein [Cohnella silvisoli]